MDPSFIDSNLDNVNSAFIFHPYKSSFNTPTFKITTPHIMIRNRNLTPNNDRVMERLPEIYVNNFSYPGSVDGSNSSFKLPRDSRAQKKIQANRMKSDEKVAQDKIKQFIQEHENSMKSRAQALKLEIQGKLQETKHQLIKSKRVIVIQAEATKVRQSSLMSSIVKDASYFAERQEKVRRRVNLSVDYRRGQRMIELKKRQKKEAARKLLKEKVDEEYSKYKKTSLVISYLKQEEMRLLEGIKSALDQQNEELCKIKEDYIASRRSSVPSK